METRAVIPGSLLRTELGAVGAALGLGAHSALRRVGFSTANSGRLSLFFSPPLPPRSRDPPPSPCPPPRPLLSGEGQ